MRLALIYCANGLGHIKRLAKITRHLLDQLPVQSVTLFCEEYPSSALRQWKDDLETRQVSFNPVKVSLPLRWHLRQEDYSGWLLNWHKAMLGWELESFDHVLSDNLVEPLLYTDRVTLIGSFLWHEVLADAFRDAKEILRYREACEHILLARRPPMIANRYFAMPGLYQQTEVNEVGIIHFCAARGAQAIRSHAKKVLVALGGARVGRPAMEQLLAVIPLLQNSRIEVRAASPLYEKLSQRCRGIVPFDFSKDDFASIDAAIIRGGMGTIADCIAAKVPMFYLNDPNPEISFNQARLSQLGIGLPLEKVLRESTAPLTDDELQAQMISSMGSLRLGGEIEAAQVLANIVRNSGGH